jgi:uncharacterized membrane protein YuzA (DUF378 family)
MTAIVLACLAALIGFFAFNVVDGVFGVAPAILGLAACIASRCLWSGAAIKQGSRYDFDPLILARMVAFR